MRVAVCTPTSGMVAACFAYSLAGLMVRARELGIETGLLMQEGSVVHANREMLTHQAIKWGATHILFLDDDMNFPETILESLLSRDKPFVACNYPRRGMPITFTAVGLDGKHVVTSAESSGLEEVEYAGFGASLIDSEVLAVSARPWFLPEYVPEANMYRTEDSSFCRRVRQAGHSVYVDHDASKGVGHRGSFTYSWEQYAVPKKIGIGTEIASLGGVNVKWAEEVV